MKEVDKRTNDLSYQNIGAAMEVHRLLGPGLLESVYEDALCVELEGREIPYERQKDVSIWYKTRTIGNLRVDLLVDNCVIVELKAVESLLPVHKAQVLTYLKITKICLGLLINFNTTVLKAGIERIIL
jgi:GxxExxY protein